MVKEEKEIPKSCMTCEHYLGSSPYDYEGEECLKAYDDPQIPPMHYLPNFPFENGCKHYELSWTLEKWGEDEDTDKSQNRRSE